MLSDAGYEVQEGYDGTKALEDFPPPADLPVGTKGKEGMKL